MTSSKKNLVERLAEGLVVGDGSYVLTLEKRGYVSAGSWTPEATVLYPESVRQLHREYLRAGADVLQTFTFYASEDTLAYKGAASDDKEHQLHTLSSEDINNAACDLAVEVAREGDALVAGGLSPVPAYSEGKGKKYVQEEFRKQCKIFCEKGVDFLIGEFFASIEEAEWAIETMKEFNKPVACTLRICTAGDMDGVSAQDCALRMARAGADVIGVNCLYDPNISLQTVGLMKSALDTAGLKTFLMMQPVAFHTQEVANNQQGYLALPEFPFGMETRLLTRMCVQDYARKAYELGVRYIGGCCGFEPYHIRAIAEELSGERGKRPPGADMHPGVQGLKMSVVKSQTNRNDTEYWKNLVPAAGRKNAKLMADVTCE